MHSRVDELVAHHGERLDQTEAACSAGATTAAEVGSRLRWTRREHRLADLDPCNAMLAVLMTGAHLELLAAQGRLVRTLEDGVERYVLS